MIRFPYTLIINSGNLTFIRICIIEDILIIIFIFKKNRQKPTKDLNIPKYTKVNGDKNGRHDNYKNS